MKNKPTQEIMAMASIELYCSNIWKAKNMAVVYVYL